jgi:hypothetical protein
MLDELEGADGHPGIEGFQRTEITNRNFGGGGKRTVHIYKMVPAMREGDSSISVGKIVYSLWNISAMATENNHARYRNE